MRSSRFVQWSSLAAVLGGGLWVAHTIALAFKPEGCIAAACYLPSRSMRVGDELAPLLIVAVMFIAVGLAGLATRAWTMGRFGRLGRTGLVTSIIGVATILSGGLVQALSYAGDFPLMPLFVISGGLALVIGLLLSGIAFLRAQAAPRWAGLLLIGSVLALLGFNDQNERVLLAAPLGIAWMIVGYVLWSDQRGIPVQPELAAE